MKEFFADEIAAAQRRSEERIAQGEQVGRPILFHASGKPAVQPLAGEKVKTAKLFYPFDPNSFRWNDISSVFVSPNVSNDPTDPDVLAVNEFAPSYFPASLSEQQRANLAAYNDIIRQAGADKPAAKTSGQTFPFRQFAAQAAGTTVENLFDADPFLFARASTDEIQQYVSNSNKGLKKTRVYETPL